MGVSGKAEDAYRIDAHGHVESELLIHFCYFVRIFLLFYVLCCVCLFVMSSRLISARILLPVIIHTHNPIKTMESYYLTFIIKLELYFPEILEQAMVHQWR